LRRSIVTYKELGLTIGLKEIQLRNEMPRVLEALAKACYDATEAPLTALVVNPQTGKPGSGRHGDGEPWHADVQRVFRYRAARGRPKPGPARRSFSGNSAKTFSPGGDRTTVDHFPEWSLTLPHW
jgi:hypothetical protein